MDFKFSPEEEAFRLEVKDWLKSELPPDWGRRGGGEDDNDETFAESKRLRKKLADRGWLTMAWPKEYGGLGATHMQQLVFNEEMSYARAPGPDNGVTMLGPTLMLNGSDELKRQYLPGIARHEWTWAQGYSEPGSGSDLASLQTRAVEDGDDFVINGSKIWTSGAHRADRIFMLVRTDPDAPKHRGITFLIADMKTPGITIRPIVNMAGVHSFNQVFFDNVRVPKSNMVGVKNRGWYTAATLLDFERSGVGRASGSRRTLEDIVAFAKDTKHNGGTLADDPLVRNELVDRWLETEAGRLISYNVTWMQSKGLVPNKEASAAKLFGSELGQRVAQTGMKIMGMYSQLMPGSKWAVLQGQLTRSYLSAFSGTIAAGTSEIQRNIIATRGLGLPRA